MKTADQLIESVISGNDPSKVIDEAKPDLTEQISKISDRTKDLPGFLDSVWRNAKDQKNKQIETLAKQAQKQAKSLDQLIGKMLVIAAGGTYR